MSVPLMINDPRAKITAQNEEVLTVKQDKTTDSFGLALFENLPAGRYKCRVTALNHQEYIGRLGEGTKLVKKFFRIILGAGGNAC